MNLWSNQHCPGFIYGPCKPHPSSNEYHSIASGDQGNPIIWQMKLHEWKDSLKDANGKWPSLTFILIWQSFKDCCSHTGYDKILNTGKLVKMDSGLCVTFGILALHNVGVFCQALIKRRGWFWTNPFLDNQVKRVHGGQALGDATSLNQCSDWKNFIVHCQKDDSYVTK